MCGIRIFFSFIHILTSQREAYNINECLCFLYFQLDDAAIQVYKDGDYGAYLDLESSLAEQAEEIEGLDSR